MIWPWQHVCPVCGFVGRFRAFAGDTGPRLHAECPACHALERHRLQKLVWDRLRTERDFRRLSCLHFAPETCLSDLLRRWFGEYVTADRDPERRTDITVDLCGLDLADASFDVVFASHVFEHILDDGKALAEVARVLRPGGFCVLPVPIVAQRTVEYGRANPDESGHVRAPGRDYFDRYARFFRRVRVFGSSDFSTRFQTHVYEDRNNPSVRFATLRPPMAGHRHSDFVPVCDVGC